MPMRWATSISARICSGFHRIEIALAVPPSIALLKVPGVIEQVRLAALRGYAHPVQDEIPKIASDAADPPVSGGNFHPRRLETVRILTRTVVTLERQVERILNEWSEL